MVLPPAGPPPPTVPQGWKAHWNAEYKAWFYENIYTEEAVWEKPTEPVYPPRAKAPLPPGPPPGYQEVQQPALVEVKSADPTSLPSTMAAVSISDPYSQAQPQQPAYALAPQPPNPQQLYTATPPPTATARVPSPQPTATGPNPGEAARGYPGAPHYPPQPAYGGYPPQQSGPPQPGYPPQQPGYPPQPNYAPPPGQAPAPGQAPPQKAGFMGMLQSKLPGGKMGTTALGVGGGLLAGALMEHEWDEHKEHERRRHHGGGLGGFGGLMRGFGGPPVVENITINDDNTTYMDGGAFNF